MAWNNKENIVKFQGDCWNRGKHKYCFYWRAKHSKTVANRAGKVLGYKCALFDLDKVGYASLPICNDTYGQTYDGKQIV